MLFTINKCCDNQNRFSTVKTTQHVHPLTVQVADLVFNVHVLHIFEKYHVFTSFKKLFWCYLWNWTQIFFLYFIVLFYIYFRFLKKIRLNDFKFFIVRWVSVVIVFFFLCSCDQMNFCTSSMLLHVELPLKNKRPSFDYHSP